MHTYIHTYSMEYIHKCVHIYIHTYLHTMLQCVHLLFKNHIYVIHIYIHTYIHTYIHSYIHIYAERSNRIYMICLFEIAFVYIFSMAYLFFCLVSYSFYWYICMRRPLGVRSPDGRERTRSLARRIQTGTYILYTHIHMHAYMLIVHNTQIYIHKYTYI